MPTKPRAFHDNMPNREKVLEAQTQQATSHARYRKGQSVLVNTLTDRGYKKLSAVVLFTRPYPNSRFSVCTVVAVLLEGSTTPLVVTSDRITLPSKKPNPR